MKHSHIVKDDVGGKLVTTYDEALQMAKYALDCDKNNLVRPLIIAIFPELKESKDDIVRKDMKKLTIEQKEQSACGVDLNEDLRGTYIQGYRKAIDDVCEWIGQQHEMLEDCFSDANDFADLVRGATLNKVQVIDKTYCLSGPLTGTHKEFVDRQIDNIRNRLKEIYGEVLPEELDKQIGYIVSETYKITRNHCAQVWNVPPKEGW